MAEAGLHPKLIEVALKLREAIGPQVLDRKHSLNLFLIGAAGPTVNGKPSLRYRLRKALQAMAGVEIYYPEDLFGELIWGTKKMNLLQLENLLATSVHAVIVCPESPGALVELGAFSNHERLCDRLIVLGDKRFAKSNSFIRLGPLRFLSQGNHGVVLWRSYAMSDLTPLVDEVLEHARTMRRTFPPVEGFSNPVYFERFLLVLISVMQPIGASSLIRLARRVVPEAPEDIVVASLSYLFHKRAIRLESKTYTVTPAGLARLESLLPYDNWRLVRRTMDELRIEALHTNYRVRLKKFVFRGKVTLP